MRIRVSAITHRGLERSGNEDCIGWNGWSMRGPQPGLLVSEFEITAPTAIVVCDGMGGHEGGEEASRLACEIITDPEAFTGVDGVAVLDRGAVLDQLGTMLQNASDAINDVGDARPELAGMGCTVVGVVIDPAGHSVVFNVGDSRCYQVDGRYLTQLSVDHRQAGSNVLQQALGGGKRLILEPDFFESPLPQSPGLLLCTDGLDDYSDPHDVERLALATGTDLVTELRNLALAGGGGDNVTVVQIEAVAPLDHRADTAPTSDANEINANKVGTAWPM